MVNLHERRKLWLIPLLLSLLIHALIFLGASLDVLWPNSVSANRPLPVRIVSVDQPKPDKRLPPNPESRLLSDANRRESGAGKPSENPRLKRETEDRLPARLGDPDADIASLVPPSPRSLPRPALPPLPPSPPQVPPQRESIPPKPETETPTPKAAEQPAPTSPAKREVKPSPPKAIEKARPAPTSEKPSPAKPPKEKPQKPQTADKKPEVKITKTQEKEKRPPKPVKKPVKKVEKRPEKKKPLEVASLPKQPQKQVTPKPVQKTPPQPQSDPLAMFRARPRTRGRPDAPFKLSDEDADRIAKASLDKDLKEEEGEAVSLDTRDYRYASYFAHIKRKIMEVWSWPEEARKYKGELLLKFVLREDGTLARVELLNSSGYRILDDEAMAAVAKAAPFNPFPPDFKRKLLPITGRFVYQQLGGVLAR